MNYQLKMNVIKSIGSNQWFYRNLQFDLSRVTDDYILPWTLQGLETGFACIGSSPAIAAEVESLLGDGQPRVIAFYSNGAEFVAGTGLPLTGDYGSVGVSGATTWREPLAHRDKPQEVPTPPGKRTGLRMFLNSTGGSGMSLAGSDGLVHPTYSYLVGTLWHELHHFAATDYNQHIRASPPYEPYWQAAMDAIKAGFPPMAWEPVTKKMVPLFTNQWASTCCRRSALA